MKQNCRILIIDDEAPIRQIMEGALKDEGHQVEVASDGASGLDKLKSFQPEIVFLDIWMPGMDGLEVLTKAKALWPQAEYVMISGHGTIETAVKATKLGAWDFIEKPLSTDKIHIVIQNIVQFRSEREEKAALLTTLRKSIALIGEAPEIVQLKQQISRVAPSESWILIFGEMGSGKNLVAQNIHYMSPRAGRPFVEINCRAIPEDLQEAELFGIEKGSMPGVDKTRKGKLEFAHGGTLYVENVEDLSSELQQKLLRYLQEKKYYRFGGAELLSHDVRVIAGTTANLEELANQGKFSRDLLVRINMLPFRTPSLREHPGDIPVLVSHFSDQIARESGSELKIFSEKALEAMKSYSWPGNVRELRNFVERVYILTPGEYIDLHDVRFAGLGEGAPDGLAEGTFREARARFEKEYLIKKIQENGGNISRTAEAIGLERSYLHRKIKSYGIEVN